MKKCFCDRCGAEIGDEKDTNKWVYMWYGVGDWIKLGHDLCKKCHKEVSAALYHPEMVKILLDGKE